MKWLAALLLVLSIPLAGGALPPCSQACGTQDFNTGGSGDPLNNHQWSVWTDSPDCPVTWDSTGGTLQRVCAAGTGDNTNALARYNGNISADGCAIFKVAASDNGGGNHDIGFEPGFVLRHQSGYPPTVDESKASADYFDQTQGAWVVRCETGLNCNTMRLGRVQTLDTLAIDCTTFGAVSVGDYMGACIRSVGTGTVITVFNLGAVDPGAPADTDGTGSWATAAGANKCVFNAALAAPNNICAAGGTICDNSGNSWGIWMRTNTVAAGATYKIDNARFYSCM
jgi:hypothetical protein